MDNSASGGAETVFSCKGISIEGKLEINEKELVVVGVSGCVISAWK